MRLNLRNHFRLLCLCCAIATLGLVTQSRAQVQTLNDGNSSVAVNLSTQAGMFQWNVDGHNYLGSSPGQWFWYRVGNNPEASINTLTLVSFVNSGNILSTVYSGNGFNLHLDYTLAGGTSGSGLSHVGETITINNTSGSLLDLHFYQYSHFNFSGGSDSVQLGRGGVGNNFNEAYQTGSGVTLGESVDTVTTPGANHGETAVLPFTLNRLNDGTATTLNDNMNAGPGDVTWALEWDKVLATSGVDSVLQISKAKDLQVPEPSVAALLLLGVAAGGLRRRNASR